MVPESQLPESWIERHVKYNLEQYEMLSGLAEEMVVDGYERADLFTEKVFSLDELKESFSSVLVPPPDDLDDNRRLVCVFVLGILGRWEEAFDYLGDTPGNFDRHNEELFSDRIDILMALSEHGRHVDVVEHGAHLALDCQAVLGETPMMVIVNTLRAESLARTGKSVDALHLFASVRDHINRNGYIVNEFLAQSVDSHIEFLALAQSTCRD